eukprot:scaffold2.g7228.t1
MARADMNENTDPAGGGDGQLRKLFASGEQIATHRANNLFHTLEQRSLTEEEQGIIEQRVALQRKMFEEYERRERRRKVAELREVVPDLTEAQAEAALALCDGREDDAAVRLSSDPAFLAQAKAGLPPPSAAPPQEQAQGAPPARRQGASRRHPARPSGPRPKVVDPSSLGDSVFVGAFRGKGFKPAPKGRGPAARRGRAAAASRAAAAEETSYDEEEEQAESGSEQPTGSEVTQEQAEQQQQEQQQEQGGRAACLQGAVASSGASEETTAGEGEAAPDQRQQQGGVEATEPFNAAKEHVLVVETSQGLRPITDSELKALRQGSPAPAGAPEAGATGQAAGPPASLAAPEQLPANAAALPDGTGAQAAGVAEAAPADAELAAGRRPSRAAAQAARKRAASARLPQEDSEATEDEAPEESGASSGEEFEGPAPRGRRGAGAPTPAAMRAQRPARLAKAVAMTAFVDDQVSDGEGTESDEEEPASRSAQRRRGGGGGAPARAGPLQRGPAPKRQRMAPAAAGEGAEADPPSAAALSSGEEERGGSSEGPGPSSRAATAGVRPPRVRAISSTGHTCRGRVRQKSHKSAELVKVGQLRTGKGWCNAGYIFPEGFQSRTLFRSSVDIGQLCVVALDRPDEPLIAKSCTGCWTGILKRINAEIEARRRAGEGLPPPPKTAIAGPEYFGLNQPNIQEAIEALDPNHLCTEYWTGKAERERAAAGLPAGAAPPRAPRGAGAGARRAPAAAVGAGRARKRRGDSESESEGEGQGGAEGEEDETQFMTNRWSAVSRAERYRKRLAENGDDAVVRPAISPYGHVMGLATWRAVLADHKACPFTKQPLKVEDLKLLTKSNIHLHRDRIIR